MKIKIRKKKIDNNRNLAKKEQQQTDRKPVYRKSK